MESDFGLRRAKGCAGLSGFDEPMMEPDYAHFRQNPAFIPTGWGTQLGVILRIPDIPEFGWNFSAVFLDFNSRWVANDQQS